LAAGALDLAGRILNDHGYEPRRVDHTVVMTNCPFHALAVGFTDLVCQMNHALLSSFADSLAPELLDANFEPGENRCCVMLTALPVPKRAAPSTATPESESRAKRRGSPE
jgi:predicted ArsR family transcriptional regulator